MSADGLSRNVGPRPHTVVLVWGRGADHSSLRSTTMAAEKPDHLEKEKAEVKWFILRQSWHSGATESHHRRMTLDQMTGAGVGARSLSAPRWHRTRAFKASLSVPFIRAPPPLLPLVTSSSYAGDSKRLCCPSICLFRPSCVSRSLHYGLDSYRK